MSFGVQTEHVRCLACAACIPLGDAQARNAFERPLVTNGAGLWARWAHYDKNPDGYAAQRSRETAVVVFEPRTKPAD